MRNQTRDIAELCALTGFDAEGYRVFPPAQQPVGSPFGERAAARVEALPPLPEAGAPVSYGWDDISPFSGAAPDAAERRKTGRDVIVASAAGGAGATTVAAALARMLSGAERVALAEASDLPLLSHHFGVRHIVPGACTALPEQLNGRGALHIHAMPESIPGPPSEWVREKVDLLARHYDRVLVDAGTGSSLREPDLNSSLLLLVATPDMNAAVRLSSLRKTLGDACGRTRLLLNKFDASQPLHLAFLDHMEKHFGDMLLPVRIRHSPLAPEALARGITVVDFAPDSGVTKDFRAVAEWLTGGSN